jgi:hypothetical protein
VRPPGVVAAVARRSAHQRTCDGNGEGDAEAAAGAVFNSHRPTRRAVKASSASASSGVVRRLPALALSTTAFPLNYATPTRVRSTWTTSRNGGELLKLSVTPQGRAARIWCGDLGAATRHPKGLCGLASVSRRQRCI